MAKIDLRIIEKAAWLLSKPKRIKILVGGRGSAKSLSVADIMIMKADQGARVCCGREYQNSIDDSVHESLKSEIERLGIETMIAQEKCIKAESGGEMIYKGLARNIASLKSISGVDYLWIEEGETVSHKSLKVLTPSIRSNAAGNEDGRMPEIWITMNRRSSKDAIAEKYLSRAEAELARTGYYEDDLMMVAQVNYDENPWFPPELELERADDYRLLDRAEYDHIWGGQYNDSIDNGIIKAEWFDACVDAHIELGFKPTGSIIVAHDPSESGDAKAVAVRHGSVFLAAEESNIGDGNEGCDWACDMAIHNRADFYTWDCDGLGITLNRQTEKNLAGKKIEVVQFRGSNSPDDPDQPYDEVVEARINRANQKTQAETYLNKRAQYYGRLSDRMYRTYLAVTGQQKAVNPDDLISFSSEIKHLSTLRSQLTRLPLKANGSGRIQLLDKPAMKKLGIESPNLGDCAMMTMMIPKIKAVYKPIRQKSIHR